MKQLPNSISSVCTIYIVALLRFCQPPQCCFLWINFLERSLYFMLSDYYIIRYYIIIDCSILFFINDYFFEKPKIALKACFLHNRSFINSLVFVRLFFINWEQNYVPASTFTNNDSTYLDVLMQNIWFNKNHRNHRKVKKLVFQKKF